MDFLTDVPSHYVDADAPIQGIIIESDIVTQLCLP